MEQWRANYRPSLIIERVLANCYFNLRTESKLSVHGTSINSEFDMSTNRPLNGNGKDYHAESFERILSSSIFENSRPGELRWGQVLQDIRSGKRGQIWKGVDANTNSSFPENLFPVISNGGVNNAWTLNKRLLDNVTCETLCVMQAKKKRKEKRTRQVNGRRQLEIRPSDKRKGDVETLGVKWPWKRSLSARSTTIIKNASRLARIYGD